MSRVSSGLVALEVQCVRLLLCAYPQGSRQRLGQKSIQPEMFDVNHTSSGCVALKHDALRDVEFVCLPEFRRVGPEARAPTVRHHNLREKTSPLLFFFSNSRQTSQHPPILYGEHVKVRNDADSRLRIRTFVDIGGRLHFTIPAVHTEYRNFSSTSRAHPRH